jgi:hypothetical protein
MGYAASLFQSFSEARAAATTVFRLIDEVIVVIEGLLLLFDIAFFQNTG